MKWSVLKEITEVPKENGLTTEEGTQNMCRRSLGAIKTFTVPRGPQLEFE